MDDVIINKVAMIERCLNRLKEEYIGHEDELETNFTRQDSVILNIQRACEAAIDSAMHVVRIKKLGVPQDSREAFSLMEGAGLISGELSRQLQLMVGFRKLAVHDYRKLDLSVVRDILENRLNQLVDYIDVLLKLEV